MADPVIRDALGRWPPGVSGHPAGRGRDEFSFNGIFRAALAQRNRSGKSVGERLVARYIKLGLAGNTAALEAIVARIDGKPAQSLTLKGDTDAPLHVRHSARLEQPAKPGLSAPEHQDAAGGEVVWSPVVDSETPTAIEHRGVVPLDGDTDHQAPDSGTE